MDGWTYISQVLSYILIHRSLQKIQGIGAPILILPWEKLRMNQINTRICLFPKPLSTVAQALRWPYIITHSIPGAGILESNVGSSLTSTSVSRQAPGVLHPQCSSMNTVLTLCQGPHSFVLHPLSPGLLCQPPGQSFCLNPLQKAETQTWSYKPLPIKFQSFPTTYRINY